MLRPIATALAVVALAGCSRTDSDPETAASNGVPPALTVAALDFPSFWIAEEVLGDSGEAILIDPAAVGTESADVIAYVSGLDPIADAAVAGLPVDAVLDVTEDLSRLGSPGSEIKDPYVWFDPLNVAKMAGTVSVRLVEVNSAKPEAREFFGLRALRIEAQALEIDQRFQTILNPCLIPDLVVERPVLTYLARAYGLDQKPLLFWDPETQPVSTLYFTLEAEPAVRGAAAENGITSVVGIDTLADGAPNDDLLQGVLDTGEVIAANQNCPLPSPTATDRPN